MRGGVSPPRSSCIRTYFMKDKFYLLDCGGLFVRYSFICPETFLLFKGYLSEGTVVRSGIDIRVTKEFMEENRWLVNEDEKSAAFLEFQSLMLATGNELLMHARALFHGAALYWKGRAWILTAPSGTGKTTQLRHWRKLLKKEMKIINGDKPLLVMREDGTVLVCSSPWRGKERYGQRGLCAPLGGIILLEQGDHNEIMRLAAADAVIPLFTEFISYPENEEQILCQAKILDQILHKVPVWKLVNLGDEDSAAMALEALKHYLEEING